MDNNILLGLLTLLGTAIGTLGGIFASAKLTNFRIQQLEEQVKKHNSIVERTFAVDHDISNIQEDMDKFTTELKEANTNINSMDNIISGKFNLNFTDKALLKSQKGKKNIHVKQGYTKCSILPIREKSIITSDKNIAKELLNYDFNVLLIPPGDIILPSLNYGFIGGTGGMINENKLALFGELSNYAYGSDIYSFLYKLDVEPISLRKGKLMDRGSLLTL